jgi:hypothetical protein
MLPDAFISIAQCIPIRILRLPAPFRVSGSGHYSVFTLFLSIPQILPVTPGVGFLYSDLVMCPWWAKTDANTALKCFTFSLAILCLSFQLCACKGGIFSDIVNLNSSQSLLFLPKSDTRNCHTALNPQTLDPVNPQTVSTITGPNNVSSTLAIA